MRLFMRPIMRRFIAILAWFIALPAIADCPNCIDGLVGPGPVKWVCPICCGKNESDFLHASGGVTEPLPPVAKAEKPDHLQSVVRIVSKHGDSSSGGSGVVIEHDGKPAVLTAHHVVHENGKPGAVTVLFRDGTQSPAKIVKADKPYGLALLSCEKYGAVAVPLAASPKLGDTLTIAGFGSHPHTFRESRGRLVGRGKPVGRYAADFIDVSTPARQGDSGGPIFSEAGEVAGILWGSSNGTTVGSHSGRLRDFIGGDAGTFKTFEGSCPNGRCPKR